MDVDLSSIDGTGTTIPLVVANMTAIAGRRMAETMARRGGLTVIPQDIPHAVVDSVIKWVKERHPFFDTPITLSPQSTVADAVSLLHKRAHGAVVVVEDGKPVGIITEDDCKSVDRFTQLHQVMSKDLTTMPDSLGAREAFDFLNQHRHKLAPVVASNGDLVGIMTRLGALRGTLYSPALDAHGKLRIAAAVGINGDVAAKAAALIAIWGRCFSCRHSTRASEEDVGSIGCDSFRKSNNPNCCWQCGYRPRNT
jgi:IMP dehydrogenase